MSDLTPKQEGFVRDYLDTGNATEAVVRNYDVKDRDVAGVIGSQNLGKLRIQQYLQDKAEKAAEIIYTLAISAENETVKLNASKDIMDRAGHKPVERTDVTSGDKPIPLLNAVFNNISNKESSDTE